MKGDQRTKSAVEDASSSSSSSCSSSSYPDESRLELGLGLSIGTTGTKGQYGRILTAKDLPYLGSQRSGVSSSSSSSWTLSKANISIGSKRRIESANGASQVVGWPPIRANRVNSMVNQGRSPSSEEPTNSLAEKCMFRSSVIAKTKNASGKKHVNTNGNEQHGLFVKVNMDGVPIGRKIDLYGHSSYDSLAHALAEMFHTSTMVNGICLAREEFETATRCPILLDASSDYVLTYEDKEGDWMLVGDVPWRMFINSVKRLRIMRVSETHRLAPPGFQERNGW